MKPSISVFFPAYNDEKSIPILIKKVEPMLKKYTSDYEIIIVDDKSPDNLAKVADNLAKKNKHIKVVHHKTNKGYGGALKSGFKTASKDLIFYTDGDGQYDPSEIARLLPHINKYDMVNGYKMKRSDNIARIIVGRLYHFFVKIMFSLPIKDVDCDFRLFNKKVIKNINLESDSGMICVEMMRKIRDKKFTIKEIPVHHYPRIEGKSQFFKVKRIIELFRDLFKLWIRIVLFKKKTYKNF